MLRDRGVNARLAKCLNSVLNVKALVGAFNQEKALVATFSMIVKTDSGTGGSFYSTSFHRTRAATAACLSVSLSECWFVRNEGRLASTIRGGMRNILRAFCVASTAL